MDYKHQLEIPHFKTKAERVESRIKKQHMAKGVAKDMKGKALKKAIANFEKK